MTADPVPAPSADAALHGTPAHAGPARRLAAAAYDGLLLLATLMISTALLQAFTGGEAITRASVGTLGEYAYRAVMAALVFAYFWVAWTRRGQTLGMKSWHLRVERADGAPMLTVDVLRRLGCAAPLYLLAITGTLLYMTGQLGPLGTIGTFVPLVASYAMLWTGRGTLHDRLSRTRMVRVPKAPKPA